MNRPCTRLVPVCPETTKLRAAIEEAEEFIRRAKALDDRLLADPGYASLPERSAVRRQSMELTRALVKVRKPR